MADVNAAVAELLGRSNRLGSDPRNTNYVGGNASVKALVSDPATGRLVELLDVKGSGGDLGTMTADEVAGLRLDRLRTLAGVYPGVKREDEMAAAFGYCLHGLGGVVGSGPAGRGAAPSIDTVLHGLTEAARVDHLHPDSGIALATAADGEDAATVAGEFGSADVAVPVTADVTGEAAAGSGIFASGWGAQRAAIYGVPAGELGALYAQRTLLKREVLPEHVAAAVFALTAGDLPLTTGLHIPAGAGVAAAFLR
jgi:hypothetical protein